MLTRRLVATLSVFGVMGLAACGGDDVEDADIMTQDTIMQQDVEMVEVPVETTDTAVVQTEISVDTAIDVDTIGDPM